MVAAGTGSLLNYLAQIPDPRSRHGRRYSLTTILATVVAAILTGARGYEGIADWIHSKERKVWWRLGYYRTPPTANGFRSVLMKIVPEHLEQAIGQWVRDMLGETVAQELQAVALDGKSLRGTLAGHERTIQLLALLDQNSGSVLRQMLVPEETNEIPTAHDLLNEVPLQGRVVTADAMHCQRETCRQIVDSGGHYLLVVKGNQADLEETIAAEFQPGCSPLYRARAAS